MKKKFKRYCFAWVAVAEAMHVFSFKFYEGDPALTAIKMWRKGITPRMFDRAHETLEAYIVSLTG